MPVLETPPARRRPVRLREVQSIVGRAIFRPLTGGLRMQRTWEDGKPAASVADSVIRPNDRLTSFERLEIYNRQYWFRLYDCFGDDFPGLRTALGKKRFHALATAYLAACPSKSFTLRNLGQFLADFLSRRPELTAPRTDLARDLVRFEWAQITAFDSAAHTPLRISELAAASPETLTLALQPHIVLLELAHACDDYILAIRKIVAAAGEDTVPRIRLRPRREHIHVAVHRHENSVYFKRLSTAEFHLLAALRQGETLVTALEAATSATPKEALTSDAIQRCFEIWTAMGWFCRPA